MDHLKGPGGGSSSELRAAQVARILRAGAAREARVCSGCAFLPDFCTCAFMRAHAPRLRGSLHAAFVVLHAKELRRLSTHRVLVGVAGAGTAVVDSKADGAMADVWAHVLSLCALDGRTPCVLYPSPDAVTAGELRARLSPPARRAGLRVVLLDGTWSEARTLARSLPADVQFVTLDRRPPADSLFAPCRVQPQPTRVCTSEAFAAVLDDWHDAATAASPVLPSGDALARIVRLCTRAHVDAYVRQAGLLGGPHSRGVGYRTWSLGVATCGALGALPASTVVDIAEFAYGVGFFTPPSGYAVRRRQQGCAEWAVVDAAECAAVARRDGSPEAQQGTLDKPPSHGGLPRLTAPACALALCCKALLFLAAGLVRERSHAQCDRVNGVRQQSQRSEAPSAAELDHHRRA